MQIKRTIEKIPDGMMLVPLFLGALCHTFSPDAGKYFGSFTNGMITGTVPILAVWFFCMGASIKHSATSTVLRKSGTLVITKILVAWVVAAIASRILPEHGGKPDSSPGCPRRCNSQTYAIPYLIVVTKSSPMA